MPNKRNGSKPSPSQVPFPAKHPTAPSTSTSDPAVHKKRSHEVLQTALGDDDGPRARRRTGSSSSVETVRVKPGFKLGFRRAKGKRVPVPALADPAPTSRVLALISSDGIAQEPQDRGESDASKARVVCDARAEAGGNVPFCMDPESTLAGGRFANFGKEPARTAALQAEEIYSSGIANGPLFQTLDDNADADHVPSWATASMLTLDPIPAGVKKDKWGCVQLGAPDLMLSIHFFDRKHLEMWDMSEGAHLLVPAKLYLTCKDSAYWDGRMAPIAAPDVRLIDAQCRAQAPPRASALAGAAGAFSVGYAGASAKYVKGVLVGIKPTEGIHIEPGWVRTYPQGTSGGKEDSDRDGIGTRGWYVKAWIPVPAALFVKRETRAFIVEARVWIGEGMEPLVAEADMSVSHLRREREMF